MFLAISFPSIDPIALAIGPFAVRWYALAYMAGLLLGWRYLRWVCTWHPQVTAPKTVDDFLLWATFAVIAGGRVGYVLFYQPAHYFAHPEEIVAIWKGGMSFHGGLLGMTLAIALYARRLRIPMLALADRVACVVPIGLFFGRIANFINGELYGRPGNVPWAMIFPTGEPLPRHPSQLYEATLEGLVLFAILLVASRLDRVRGRYGLLTGLFLFGYATFRITGELFREPDLQIGFLAGGTTMGQILSLPLLFVGLLLVTLAWVRRH